MSKIKIVYNLSEKGRKAILLQGGDGKAEQIIETDITPTPELLERASVYSDGTTVWKINDQVHTDAEIIGTWNFTGYMLNVRGSFYEEHKPYVRKKAVQKPVRFDAPQTVESLLAYVKNTEMVVASKMAELNVLLPEKIALWEKAVAEHKERARAAAEHEAEEKVQREVEKARRKQEKADWIATHGSDYLKRATKLEYDCQRQYVIERAGLELPDFQVDFDDQAEWNSRSCPGEEALTEVERLIEQGFEAKCIWLTNIIPVADSDDDDYYRDESEPREAIVIRGYLEKYDLIKVV